MNESLYLFVIVTSLLLIATAVGQVLARRSNSAKQQSVIANLNARTNAWWVMLVILGAAALMGEQAIIVLFGLISFFALREFVTLTPTKAGDRLALFLAFFILIPAQYYLLSDKWYGLMTLLIPVYGFLLLPAITALTQDIDHFLERTTKLQWGVMITVYCISYAPALLLLDIPGFEGKSLLLMFFLIFVVQISDVLQYVFGKIFGKTPVAPLVSPSKTWEGLIGGGIAAILAGTAMWWITPFTPWEAMLLSAVIVLMGFLGGLTLSAVKRSLGVKDWGTMIEGHGGMLDRMDSVCFAAPVFFHLVRYFFSAG